MRLNSEEGYQNWRDKMGYQLRGKYTPQNAGGRQDTPTGLELLLMLIDFKRQRCEALYEDCVKEAKDRTISRCLKVTDFERIRHAKWLRHCEEQKRRCLADADLGHDYGWELYLEN